jgi:excisionase family DNA binding protein
MLRRTGGCQLRETSASGFEWSAGSADAQPRLPAPLPIPPGATPKLLLTPDEAAGALGIGRTKLYELLATGKLPSVRIGASRRVSMEVLIEFVRHLDPADDQPRIY